MKNEVKYQRENPHEVVFNLEYNAERSALIIPEYGRHLQKLIDQATAISDRDERNKAAKYIIQVMGSLNPHLRDVPDFQHKLWDQLFIMSDFKIEVDSPYPIPSREVLQLRPDPLRYPQRFPQYRFYGNNIQYMINVAIGWEDGEMKEALTKVIANHMKKMFLSWNKDTVTDEVIFEHLFEMSHGKLDLREGSEELLNMNEIMRTNNKISNKSMYAQQQQNKPPQKSNNLKKPNNGFKKNNNNNNSRKPNIG